MKKQSTKGRGRAPAGLVRNNAAAAAPTSRLTHLTWNLSTKLVRNEKMEGRDYVVVPMVMLTEGVHSGSNGPLFYPASEIKKSAKVWNHKPVVVYHTEIDGVGVSACAPELLTKQKIGVVMNTQWDDKKKRLTAEAWLEPERVKEVDIRVWNAIQKQEMMELSTGLFTENEQLDEAEDFNGEKYEWIARNHGPDHLAVLPDQIGACSIEKGAGFIRNELRSSFHAMDDEDVELCRAQILTVLNSQKKQSNAIKLLLANEASHEQVREALCQALQAFYPPDEGYAYPWIEAVYDAFVVYSLNGRLFKVGYSASDAGVKLVGEPSAVRRVIDYEAVGASPVGNKKKDSKPSKYPTEEKTMNKEQLVADLITNGGYSETDRPWLMGLDEKALTAMRSASTAVANKAKAPASTTSAAPAAAPVANAEPAKPAATAKVEEGLTANQKAALAYGERMLAENRAKLTQVITTNKANKFTAEQLAALPIDTLEGLAALAQNAAPASPEVTSPALFTGQAPVGNSTTNGKQLTTEDALVAPTMNFDAPASKK